jgi:hypothetical protein
VERRHWGQEGEEGEQRGTGEWSGGTGKGARENNAALVVNTDRRGAAALGTGRGGGRMTRRTGVTPPACWNRGVDPPDNRRGGGGPARDAPPSTSSLSA